jgi:hypothetical protein
MRNEVNASSANWPVAGGGCKSLQVFRVWVESSEFLCTNRCDTPLSCSWIANGRKVPEKREEGCQSLCRHIVRQEERDFLHSLIIHPPPLTSHQSFMCPASHAPRLHSISSITAQPIPTYPTNRCRHYTKQHHVNHPLTAIGDGAVVVWLVSASPSVTFSTHHRTTRWRTQDGIDAVNNWHVSPMKTTTIRRPVHLN